MVHGKSCACGQEAKHLYEEWAKHQEDPSYRMEWPVWYTCFHCHEGVKMPRRCGGCKAIIYCGPKCAKENWTTHIVPGVGMRQGHKHNCASVKGHMLELEKFNQISEPFSWNVKNGSYYDYDLTLGSFKLHGGGPAFGFWNIPPCGSVKEKAFGQALQRATHFDEVEGWKLPDKDIPWLNFDEARGRNPPKSLPNFEDSWTSYYEWRGLPMSSPAALLLHWPLSVYRLLRELDISPGTAEDRKTVKIFMEGIETELDLLPVFGELALLFPFTDLHLVLFGDAVFNLVRSARKGSLARKACIYSYTAPESVGSGTVQLTLHSKNPHYDPHIFTERPDAIIGLNAGVTTYPEWSPIILHAFKKDIPLAVTDDLHVALDECDRVILGMISKEVGKATPEESLRLRRAMMKSEREKILNDFMCPAGKVPRANFLPRANNAWLYIINPVNDKV
ncbi:hypothetical protein SISSUDRAFT_445453 [Sistotremastrum suecicum HHB10207 ss-3]|uniref:MYND-type domain-containing protein n=1 Tax=Sistotremastrum suecicum HHB10207 ss-3 TaxID=1314776 RepID=A0A165YA40_9AGAM|nr:hypothetical protein SISSUDRAFT_445453 [Sistotremastrum suecicum HHB10207 ss-3]